jgi:hypothetical protein
MKMELKIFMCFINFQRIQVFKGALNENVILLLLYLLRELGGNKNRTERDVLSDFSAWGEVTSM